VNGENYSLRNGPLPERSWAMQLSRTSVVGDQQRTERTSEWHNGSATEFQKPES